VPEIDMPAGLPAWMHLQDGWPGAPARTISRSAATSR
jgi:hypothetical protein